MTLSRRAVWDALNHASGHLTAEQIHSRLAADVPTIALSTVYRTLNLLEEQGLAHHIVVDDEARFGRASHPHHHAVCGECGRVTEIDQRMIEGVLASIKTASGVVPDSAAVITIRGVCTERRIPDLVR